MIRFLLYIAAIFLVFRLVAVVLDATEFNACRDKGGSPVYCIWGIKL